MRGEEVAYLLLEVGWNPFAEDRDGIGQDGAHRQVQRIDFLGRQAGPPAERQQPCRMHDLVAVRIPDAGHERLVAEQVLQC